MTGAKANGGPIIKKRAQNLSGAGAVIFTCAGIFTLPGIFTNTFTYRILF
jgi:hypothetical protein